jgi:ribosomal protein L7/L12
MTYDDLDQDQRSELVEAGITFMKALTKFWGIDEGQKFWEAMANVIDPGIKNDIFLRMLTSEGVGRITIQTVNAHRMIETIKAIRSITGLGLKESIDIIDMVSCGRSAEISAPSNMSRSVATQILRDAGCTCY